MVAWGPPWPAVEHPVTLENPPHAPCCSAAATTCRVRVRGREEWPQHSASRHSCAGVRLRACPRHPHAGHMEPHRAAYTRIERHGHIMAHGSAAPEPNSRTVAAGAAARSAGRACSSAHSTARHGTRRHSSHKGVGVGPAASRRGQDRVEKGLVAAGRRDRLGVVGGRALGERRAHARRQRVARIRERESTLERRFFFFWADEEILLAPSARALHTLR